MNRMMVALAVASAMLAGTAGAQTARVQPATITERQVALDATMQLYQLDACGIRPAELAQYVPYVRTWVDTHTWQGRPFKNEIAQSGMIRMLANPAMRSGICAQTGRPETIATFKRQIPALVANLRRLHASAHP